MNGFENLVIDHGNPRWWLSLNVWVVPKDNPDDPWPGVIHPKVGTLYLLKANVRNIGAFPVENAKVKFYWANPSLGITRNKNANDIGFGYVTVEAGKTAEVLCLATWDPIFINQGHECILAEVVQSQDEPKFGPLDGQHDPHVAQHNLSVIKTTQGNKFHFVFEVCNTERKEQIFTINAHEAELSSLGSLVKGLSDDIINANGSVHDIGFVGSPCPLEDDPKQPMINNLKIAPFSCTGFSLVGQLEGKAALVHLTQLIEDRVVGGLSVLIIRKEDKEI